MTIVVNNAGKQRWLEYIVGKQSTTENLVYRIYTNSGYTPAETDNIGDYTIMTGGGYANMELQGASWNVTLSGTSPAKAEHPRIFWEFTGTPTGNAQGYIAAGKNSGTLIIAESRPTIVPGPDVPVDILPRIYFDSL